MSFTPDEMGQFEELLRNAFQGRVVSNYILIAEMIGDEGADIEIYLSEMMTPWLTQGILDYAQDLIRNVQYDGYNDQEP